jgi:hypothetical protein
VAAPSFAGIERAVEILESQARETDVQTGPILPGEPRPLQLQIVRGGLLEDLSIPVDRGCGVWFDLDQSARLEAKSTARWVQVSDGLMRLLEGDDDALAFVIAHEFGHRVLRARPGGADATCGEACEGEADRLGMIFVKRAGYAVERAPAALLTIAGARHGFLDYRPGAMRRRAARLQALIAHEASQPIMPSATPPAGPPLQFEPTDGKRF